MKEQHPNTTTAGLVLYLSLSLLGSWFVAATLNVFSLSAAPAPVGTRLFTTSLLYAVTMGWQPLVATWLVRRWVDRVNDDELGLRPASHVFALLGVAAVFACVGAATVLAWVLMLAGWTQPASFTGDAEAPPINDGSWLTAIISPSFALAGTLILTWIQSFAEEVGWRGYFLPRAMEQFGHWRGLIIQGFAWGAWYAPVLFFATYGPKSLSTSIAKSLGFALTCGLLGALLGWLRLASRSLIPVITTNTTLTLIAGLPYVLYGIDAGLRSAIFEPAGWIALALAFGILACSPWRSVVERHGLDKGAGAAGTGVTVRMHLSDPSSDDGRGYH